jgi:hypothetical protein
MPDVEIHNVENKALFMGDNEFEQGTLTVPANTTVPAGATLVRELDGKFSPAGGEASDILAINPAPVKNKSAAPADISFRALISGKVRRDLVTFGGAAITDAQADQLRSYGIIARTVYNTARLDNQ